MIVLFLLNKNRVAGLFPKIKILRFAQYDSKYSSSFWRILGVEAKKHNVILRATPEESVLTIFSTPVQIIRS